MDDSASGISFSFQPSEIYEQTSTLQYLNSQLVAHGFAKPPGLTLDGLSVEGGERVIKCLMGMLSQRMDDVKRTEELGSKLRTLAYENDRFQSMHRTAVDSGANAEREMNLHKSKLIAMQKQHASEITAHKQTSAELQKARTALQYLRSTTQNELKRKDREVERVLERWNKVADSQVKLAGINSSGLHCANYATAAMDGELVNGKKSLMEQALEQAEEARGELVKENEGFRSVIFSTAKVLQNITYDVKSRGVDGHIESPHLTPTAVFAPPTSTLSHSDNAHTKIRELISALRDAISALSTQENLQPSSKSQASDEDVTKLKETITSLRAELEQHRQSSVTASTEAQKLFDRFTKGASERLRATRHAIPDLSVELISQPEQDEIRTTLENRAKELEAERERFTAATIKLGKERTALEEERMKLVEEKRRWAMEQMLAELPPTPGPDPDLVSTSDSTSTLKPTNVKSKSSSPRRVSASKAGCVRSPRKSVVMLKSPSRKFVGTSAKRVTFEEGHGQDMAGVAYAPRHPAAKRAKTRRESKLFEAVDVLYDPEDRQGNDSGKQGGGQKQIALTATGVEAELCRSTTPDDPPPPVILSNFASRPRAAGAIATVKSSAIVPAPAPLIKPSLPLVLPTTFKLPPPSPASSLSLQPLPIASSSSSNSLSSAQAASARTQPGQGPEAQPAVSAQPCASPSPPSNFDKIPLAPIRLFPSPARTPRCLSLGVDNAHNKKHKYSPARPSPLSRILMIADSPSRWPSSPSPGVETILEEEESGDDRESLLSANTVTPEPLGVILKRGLGLEPIDEPSPLRDVGGGNHRDHRNDDAGLQRGEGGNIKSSVMGTVHVDTNAENAKDEQREKRFTTKEKGKGRAVGLATEKENIGANLERQEVHVAAVSAPATKPVLKMAASRKSKIHGLGALPPSASGSGSMSSRAVASKKGVVKGSVNSGGGSKIKPSGVKRVPVGSVPAEKASGRII